MAKNENIIDLKMDVDGVYKPKSELRKDVRPKKKMERVFVNNASKMQQFLYGLEVGTDLLIRLNKTFK